MAEEFDIQIIGLAELGETLDYIPINLAKYILTEALHEGADEFVQAAQGLAPVAALPSHKDSEPGELRESIGAVVKLGKNLDYGVASVGPLHDKSKYNGTTHTHSPGVYGFFVEFGTRFMSAKPFLRPAYQAAKDRALEAFANGIATRMNKLVGAVRSLGE